MAEEGKDLGPEEHSIKVFLSGNSGNKEVRIFKQKYLFNDKFYQLYKSPNKRKYNRLISSEILYYLFALMCTIM